MTDSLKQSLRDGRYAVIRVLGEGSQAATFEAVDKRDGALVAVKRFRVRGASSWKEVELAEREARVLASLSGAGGVARGKSGAAFASDGPSSGPVMPSNLPRYIEHFEEDGELYLVTEMIEGESLLALRKRGASFGEADAARLLRDASFALDFLHGRSPPVIHRDIKPSNVLRRPDGSFAIIDFGSVRDRLKPEGGSTVVGTFGYMAPEQFQGRAMPASDMYGLGATVLSMLTGEEPEKLPHKGLAIDVVSALSRARVSPAMVAALTAMLDPNPDTRPSNLAPLLASLPMSAAPAPNQAPPSRGGRREPRRDERRDERRAPDPPTPPARGASAAMQIDRSARARRGPLIPPPFGPIVMLALSLGQVAVTIALGVLVPVLFTILSVVFGKGMREAGRTTRAAGKVAVAAIGRVKEILRGSELTGPEVEAPRVDVSGPRVDVPGARVRVGGERAGAQPRWVDGVERAADEVARAAEEAARAAEEENATHEAAEAEREAAKAEREAAKAEREAARERDRAARRGRRR